MPLTREDLNAIREAVHDDDGRARRPWWRSGIALLIGCLLALDGVELAALVDFLLTR